MQEDKKNQCHIKYKGGCLGCLLEIVGVIGICYENASGRATMLQRVGESERKFLT